MDPRTFPAAHEQPTMSVPEAGHWLGLGRASSYAAAQRGDLPTIKLGGRLVVPTAALARILELDTAGGVA